MSDRLDFVDPHSRGTGLARHYVTVGAPASGAHALRLGAELDVQAAAPIEGPAGRMDWAGMLEFTAATSVVVLRGEDLLHEWYADGVNRDSLLLGASMTKSVLASACGRAVERGELDLHSPVIDLVPELADSGYAPCRVEDVAAMTSGTAWVEDHRDPDGAAVALIGAFRAGVGSSRGLLARVGAGVGPGRQWAYNTADSQVLDWCRERATGTTFAEAVADLWAAIGAESPATLGVDGPAGAALAGGGLCVSARDWARLGLLMSGGPPGLSSAWVEKASRPSAEFTRPGRLTDDVTRLLGYGLHWWPYDNEGRTVVADGMRGQFTMIDRDTGVVVVKTSGWPHADAGHDLLCRDLSLRAMRALADAAALS